MTSASNSQTAHSVAKSLKARDCMAGTDMMLITASERDVIVAALSETEQKQDRMGESPRDASGNSPASNASSGDLPAAVPCVVVPKEPTEEMAQAAAHIVILADTDGAANRAKRIYRAMLSVAPHERNGT